MSVLLQLLLYVVVLQLSPMYCHINHRQNCMSLSLSLFRWYGSRSKSNPGDNQRYSDDSSLVMKKRCHCEKTSINMSIFFSYWTLDPIKVIEITTTCVSFVSSVGEGRTEKERQPMSIIYVQEWTGSLKQPVTSFWDLLRRAEPDLASTG